MRKLLLCLQITEGIVRKKYKIKNFIINLLNMLKIIKFTKKSFLLYLKHQAANAKIIKTKTGKFLNLIFLYSNYYFLFYQIFINFIKKLNEI